MYCKNCGTKINDEKICHQCGTENTAAPKAESGLTEPEKAVSKTPSKKKNLAIIAIVLVAAIVGAVFLPGVLNGKEEVWLISSIRLSNNTVDFEYDDNGNCVERIVYYSDGETDDFRYEYDENNNCIKEITSDWEISYKYDDNGAVVRSSNADGDTEKYEYDGEGNCTKITHYDSDGKTIATVLNKYENGNLVEINEYYTELEESEHTVCEYDDKGNIVRRANLLDDGTERFVSSYKYDENGNCIRIDSFDRGESLGYNVYEYDEKGNMIKESSYSGKKLDYIFDFEYDDNGNCVKKIIKAGTMLSDGEIIYEYISVKLTKKAAEKVREFQKDILEDTEQRMEYMAY